MEPRRISMSPYAFFVQKNLDDFKKLHLDNEMNLGQFSKDCSDKWRAMSDSKKKGYRDLAKEEADFYNDVLAADPISTENESESESEEDSSKNAKGGGPYEESRCTVPKRNLSAFFWFCNEVREEVRQTQSVHSLFGEKVKEYVSRWRALSDSERVKFEDIAAKDKERYEKELVIYNREKDTDTRKNLLKGRLTNDSSKLQQLKK